jgi:hypothetical protein
VRMVVGLRQSEGNSLRMGGGGGGGGLFLFNHVFNNNFVCELNQKALGLLNFLSKHLEDRVTDQEEAVG